MKYRFCYPDPHSSDPSRIVYAMVYDVTFNPPDHTDSPQFLRDAQGVVHSVVKNHEGIWCYCDITVLRDWLLQDGKNTVPKETLVTCITCLNSGHEP